MEFKKLIKNEKVFIKKEELFKILCKYLKENYKIIHILFFYIYWRKLFIILVKIV